MEVSSCPELLIVDDERLIAPDVASALAERL